MYSEVICLWFTKNSVFAAELNLKLKPQANNIRISKQYQNKPKFDI